jgi:hypothetical protein
MIAVNRRAECDIDAAQGFDIDPIHVIGLVDAARTTSPSLRFHSFFPDQRIRDISGVFQARAWSFSLPFFPAFFSAVTTFRRLQIPVTTSVSGYSPDRLRFPLGFLPAITQTRAVLVASPLIFLGAQPRGDRRLEKGGPRITFCLSTRISTLAVMPGLRPDHRFLHRA